MNEHGHGAHPSPPHVHPEGPGYETKDASIPALLRFLIGLVIFCTIVQFAMLGIYRVFDRSKPEKYQPKAPTNPPTNQYEQLRELRRNETQALSGYGWVDRKEGVVRIPIERAIALVAEKGVRFGKGPKTEIEMNSHAGTPTLSPSGTEPAGKASERKEPKP
jgi:hypothetical protein